MSEWKDTADETPAKPGCYVVWMISDEGDGHVVEWRDAARWDGSGWNARPEVAFWFDRAFDSLAEAKAAHGGAIDRRPQAE